MNRKSQSNFSTFIILTFFSLIVSAALFFLLIKYQSSTDIDNRTRDKLFFITLFPLSFSASFCFFGVLKSFATYKGNQFNGKLMLRGPVVLFFLILVAGFKLIPNLEPFEYTIQLVKTNREPLSIQGNVNLSLEGQIVAGQIDHNGAVRYGGISEKYYDQTVILQLPDLEWQFLNGTKELKIRLSGKSQEVILRRPPMFGQIKGKVFNSGDDNEVGLKDATISVAGQMFVTTGSGRFDIAIPEDRQDSEYQIEVEKHGYKTWNHIIKINGDDILISMIKQ